MRVGDVSRRRRSADPPRQRYYGLYRQIRYAARMGGCKTDILTILRKKEVVMVRAIFTPYWGMGYQVTTPQGVVGIATEEATRIMLGNQYKGANTPQEGNIDEKYLPA